MELDRPILFKADKPVGIISLLLNSGLSCVGGITLLMMPFFQGLMENAAQQGTAAERAQMKEQMAQSAAQFERLGPLKDMLPVLGIVSILLAIALFVQSIGMFKSLKWGFTLGVILNGISLVYALALQSWSGMILPGLFGAYCLMRLMGKLGPKPVNPLN